MRHGRKLNIGRLISTPNTAQNVPATKSPNISPAKNRLAGRYAVIPPYRRMTVFASQLVNTDGAGGRVAAMIFGPKKVIVVAGVNKIVKDVTSAEKRVKEWTAPQNAKRLNRKTPCTETGQCADCSSPDRICNIYVTLAKKPARIDVVVILVGENLGI